VSTSSDLKVCLHDVKNGKLLFEIQINEKTAPEPTEEEKQQETPDRVKKNMTYSDFKRNQEALLNKVPKRKKQRDDPEYIWACEFLNGETYEFLTSSNNGSVKRFKIVGQTIELLNTYVGHTHRVRQISMLPDNKHFSTCSTDSTVRIWDFNKEVEAVC